MNRSIFAMTVWALLFSVQVAAQVQDKETQDRIMSYYAAYLHTAQCAPCGVSVSYRDSTYRVELTMRAYGEDLKNDPTNIKDRLAQVKSGFEAISKTIKYKCTGSELVIWKGEGNGFSSYQEFVRPYL